MGNAFVKMSAHIQSVRQCSTVMCLFSTTSCRKARLTRWVLPKCLIVVFPVFIVVMAVVLSSMKRAWSFLPNNASHKVSPGMAETRMAWSAATSSASGVEWDTHDCRFETAARGKKVFLARMHVKAPVVLRPVSLHPAKSASL
jgi:hypothetical protein